MEKLLSVGWIKHSIGSFELDYKWDVSNGETLALFGPSGSGKSLTLNLLSGFITPQNAYFELDSTLLVDTSKGVYKAIEKRDIGYVPQEYNLFPHLSVEKNIEYGLFNWKEFQKNTRVSELLHWLQIEDLRFRSPETLSAGQKQRVAFARSIARKPKLLLLDEPFANLDESLRNVLRQKLREEIIELSIPVIFVSHDWSDVEALAHQVSVLSQGTIVDGGIVGKVHKPMIEPSPPLVSENRIMLYGNVTQTDRDGHLSTCSVNGVSLIVRQSIVNTGKELSLTIDPRDISLSFDRFVNSTIENVLTGRIIGSANLDSLQTELTIDCGLGTDINIMVSRQLFDRCGVKPDQPVWVLVRAHDIRVK